MPLSADDKTYQPPAGTVDVYFGPKAPAGEESNWVQTIPGNGWFMILRLYWPKATPPSILPPGIKQAH